MPLMEAFRGISGRLSDIQDSLGEGRRMGRGNAADANPYFKGNLARINPTAEPTAQSKGKEPGQREERAMLANGCFSFAVLVSSLSVDLAQTQARRDDDRFSWLLGSLWFEAVAAIRRYVAARWNGVACACLECIRQVKGRLSYCRLTRQGVQLPRKVRSTVGSHP